MLFYIVLVPKTSLVRGQNCQDQKSNSAGRSERELLGPWPGARSGTVISQTPNIYRTFRDFRIQLSLVFALKHPKDIFQNWRFASVLLLTGTQKHTSAWPEEHHETGRYKPMQKTVIGMNKMCISIKKPPHVCSRPRAFFPISFIIKTTAT